VYVLARAKRLDQRRVLREMREHAQLDLRVVGRDEQMPVLGNERAPDLTPGRRADRNVLQVGIAAAQTPRRRHRLIERMNQLRQRIQIRTLQFLQHAPLQDQPHDLVLLRHVLEHVCRRRRRLRLHRAARGRRRLERHLLEQDVAKLLGRVDVERGARQLEDAPAQRRHFRVERA
jgi:hypothetical protein